MSHEIGNFSFGIVRAAVVPAIHGKWEVRDVPTPHPATNQVLIKIHASGLCHTDDHFAEGAFPTSLFFSYYQS